MHIVYACEQVCEQVCMRVYACAAAALRLCNIAVSGDGKEASM